MRTVSTASSLLLVISLGLWLTRCFAQLEDVRRGNRNVANYPAGLSDAKDLETFLDPFFKAKLEELHCPGATVAVVKDGKPVLAKGYGYADISKKTLVDPEKTRFFVASVSKLFTATAVMQLYDRGLVRLDEDVNHYLKHDQLEQNYPQPVTLFNLLTHTAGLEDLSNVMGGTPRRIFPPGEVISYTNYGLDLAGEAVADVSGNPFAEFVDKNILLPLEMRHSSFVPPLDGAPDVARGYVYDDGKFEAGARPLDDVVPSGSLVSTATDMAHFMIAHLQRGRYGESRILSESAANLMQKRQFSNHPKLPGIGFGFFENRKNGIRVLEHNGDLEGFESKLYLLPEKNVGLFVAVNASNYRLPNDLTAQFMDHYYPANEAPETASLSEPLDHYAGSYLYTRCPRSTIGKIAALFLQVKVAPDSKGGVVLAYPDLFPWGPVHANEIEPLLFRPVPGSGTMDDVGFRQDPRGHITFLFQGEFAYQKLAWWQTAEVQLAIGAVLLTTFLLGCVLLVGHAIYRRWRKVSFARTFPVARNAVRTVWIVGLLNLVFVVGLTATLNAVGPSGLGDRVPMPIRWLLIIPLVTAVLSIVLLILNVLAWKNAWWSVTERIFHLMYSLAAVGFIFYLNYWNLLGFRY